MQTRGNMAKADGVLNGMAAAGQAEKRAKGESGMSKPISQVIRTCGRCAKEYKTPERRQKYCGSECAQEARIETYRAEINALIAAGKVPSTRRQASFLGAKFYYTGKPCGNGHIDVRITNTKNCVICTRDKHRRDNALKARNRESRPKPVKVVESVQTSAVFLHLLWDWRPVVVTL